MQKFRTFLTPLVIALFVSILAFVLFFPPFYTSNDERNYIQNAYLISHGDLVQQGVDCIPGNEAYGYFNGEGCIAKYNLGLSLIFLPFVLIHWKLTFVVAFVTFLVGIYIFSKLLKHYQLDQKFVYLYAFFPAFVYYSHKVMTETFSNTLILALYYLLFAQRKKPNNTFFYYLVLGVLGGVFVLIRYTNALILIIFLVFHFYYLFKENLSRHEWLVRLTSLTVGALPFIIVFFYINKTFYEGWISSGYTYSNEEFLVLGSLILPQLKQYFTILNIIYPFMLITIFVSKIREKWVILTTLVVLLLFYMGFPGYHYNSGILNFVFGIRFVVPILGLVILLYSDVVSLSLAKLKNIKHLNLFYKYQKVLVGGVIFVLSLNVGVMSYILYEKVDGYAKASEKIYETTKEDDVIYDTPCIYFNDAFKKGSRVIDLKEE